MRTIKFRGKDFLGRWHHGNLHLATGGSNLMIQVDSFDSFGVLPETVGQFAGLYDKNDKEIYEGDIVRTYVAIKDYEEEIEEQFFRVGVIRFTRGQFALTKCTNYVDKEMQTPHRWVSNKQALYPYPAYRSEIIGNIHDNPELLKGGKE